MVALNNAISTIYLVLVFFNTFFAASRPGMVTPFDYLLAAGPLVKLFKIDLLDDILLLFVGFLV